MNNTIKNHKKYCKCVKCKAIRGETKGKNNPFYGKKHSKESKRKIKSHHANFKAENHPCWKGRRLKDNYIYILKPNHPNARKDGYIKRSRYKMSQKLKRPLLKQEVVHHLDLDKFNDKLGNLLLFKNNGKHRLFHSKLYEYILKRFGIKEIKRYIKWFNRR